MAIQLAGNFSAGWAILAGVIGAMAMLPVMYGGKAMGMTTMDLLRTLGTMMVPKADKNVIYGIGLMMHAMMGGVFGIVHSGLLHALDPSSGATATLLGIVIGAVHGTVIVAMMPTMLMMAHPLFKDGTNPPPGVAMQAMGKMTPMGMTMAHVVYGLVVGAIYTGALG